MKTFKRFFATMVAGILSFPYLLTAQNEVTYIDNPGVQDSSYVQQDMLAEGAKSSGSGIIIIIIVIVIAFTTTVFFYLSKKKK